MRSNTLLGRCPIILATSFLLLCLTNPAVDARRLPSPFLSSQGYTHYHTKISPVSSSGSSISTTGKSKIRQSRKQQQKILESQEYETDLKLAEHGDLENEPTLEEIRAALGPIGSTIAGGVEVGVITAGSYISGGLLGYCIGGVFGIPSVFQPSSAEVVRSLSGEIRHRIMNLHGKAAKQAGSWAKLSAAFSGFHALSRVVRGGKEDKWNGVLGSAATGAFLSRKAGPRAMVQGGATYAGFTLLMDRMFAGGNGAGQITDESPMMDEEVAFDDAALVGQ